MSITPQNLGATNGSLIEGAVNPSSVRKWLTHVEDHLYQEATEFLVLGLFSEGIAVRCERQLLEAKTASDVYNFLLEKCFQGDHTKTFQWFVFALRELGRDLRGYYLVADCLKRFDLEMPPPLAESEKTRNLKFFHCLVKIGTKARGMDLETKLKQRFSKRSFLCINHRKIPNLANLFLRLYQAKFIGSKNTQPLVDALRKYGATQCLCYLNAYHKSVHLPAIADVENMTPDDFGSSSDPSSLAGASSPAPSRQQQERINTKFKHMHKYSELDVIKEAYPPHQDTVVEGGEQCGEESDADDDGDKGFEGSKLLRRQKARGQFMKSDEGEHSQGLVYQPVQPTGRKRKCLGISSTWAIVLLLFLALFGALLAKMWLPLLLLDKSEEQLVQEGSVVILQELNRFYHHNVSIKASASNFYNVDIYCSQTSCRNLPTNVSHVPTESRTLKNYTNVYLMPGSVIKYGTGDPNAHIHVYVTSGCERFDTFDPYDLSDGVYTVQSEWISYGSPKRYEVPEWNYYSIYFTGSPNNVSVSVNFTVVSINVSGMDKFVCRLDETNDRCNVKLTFGTTKSCLVADIHGSISNGSKLIELDSNVTRFWKEWDLGLSLPLLFLFTIVLLVVAICVTCCCCCLCVCCKQSTSHSSVHVYVSPEIIARPGTV